MLSWIRRSAIAEADRIPHHGGGDIAVHEPSRLLIHLAGEFAPEIARLWPAPHTPFVLAETARRHLALAALAAIGETDVRPGPGFVAAALDGPLRRAVSAVMPGAPSGLSRALDHLGEAPWTAADYRLLLARLAEPAAAKLLRHAQVITAAEVRALSALPASILAQGGVVLKLSEAQSRLVAQCLEALTRRDGEETALALVRNWAHTSSPKALFERIKRDIEPATVTPFHPGTARLRPLTTREALHDAARRYDNCLRTRVIGAGSQYYEWLGPPGVILEVTPDPLWGWMLDEGRLAQNATVPEALQIEIAAELKAIGVHVGRGLWNLRHALEAADSATFSFDDETVYRNWAFGD